MVGIRRWIRICLAVVAGGTLVAACENTGGPTGPAAVALVDVTSPIETVVAVGRTAQLNAVARDAAGTPQSVTFAWTSTVTAAATVNPATGLVTGVAPGTTTVRVSQDRGAVTGEIQMRVVNANLPVVGAALADAFFQSVRVALGTAPSNAVSEQVTACQASIASGNVLAIDRCLVAIAAVTGANGNDTALLGTVRLYATYARTRLSL